MNLKYFTLSQSLTQKATHRIPFLWHTGNDTLSDRKLIGDGQQPGAWNGRKGGYKGAWENFLV